MAILNRYGLAVRGVAADPKAHPVLSQVRAEADGSTVATNGSVVMAVGPVDRAKVRGLDIEDESDCSIPSGGVGLPLAMVDEAAKKAPKGNPREQNVAVTRCDSKRVEITTAVKGREQRIAEMPVRGTYPDWRTFLRDKRKACRSGKVCVDRRDLLQLLKAMETWMGGNN